MAKTTIIAALGRDRTAFCRWTPEQLRAGLASGRAHLARLKEAMRRQEARIVEIKALIAQCEDD